MGRAKVILGARFCMGRGRWQKNPHTNWAGTFARSDEQGGLGRIHVDSDRTHRPRARRGWPDCQAAAGPRGPAKSRRRANWLPACHPGRLPRASNRPRRQATRSPGPWRSRYPGLPGTGPLPGGRRTNVLAGGPVRLQPRSAHVCTLRRPRFTDSPQGRRAGASGWGVSRRGPRYIYSHTDPTPTTQ